MSAGKRQAGKQSVARTKTRKKASATKAHLERKLRGAKSDARGLRYEQTVANYFINKGWSPRHRIRKYGYEYDLYAEKSEIFSTKYLVVECKGKGRVSAKDVVRFIVKVDLVGKHLPEVMLAKPPLYAYLCYSEDVDQDAAAVAKRHKPSIKLLKIKS
jgi:hypothetical protein